MKASPAAAAKATPNKPVLQLLAKGVSLQTAVEPGRVRPVLWNLHGYIEGCFFRGSVFSGKGLIIAGSFWFLLPESKLNKYNGLRCVRCPSSYCIKRDSSPVTPLVKTDTPRARAAAGYIWR